LSAIIYCIFTAQAQTLGTTMTCWGQVITAGCAATRHCGDQHRSGYLVNISWQRWICILLFCMSGCHLA